MNNLKELDFPKIKTYINNKFGPKSLKPLSDIDRPFTQNELKEFSINKYVTIGNHTSDHSNLNFINEINCKKKIINAENDIKKLIGNSSKIFSFPNSKSNTHSQKILDSLKFNYAISESFKNYNLNKIESNQYLKFGRYCFLRNKSIDWQIQMCMSKFSPYIQMLNLKDKLTT